jgi:hypothetical protein
VIRVANRKPDLGTEAEMLARLRAMTDAINKLRQDFQTSVRDQKPRRERAMAPDKPKRKKKR